jgi:hypothetical protein
MPKKLFEKGNPGGPGRPKKDPLVKKAAKMTRNEVEECLVRYLRHSVSELKELIKNDKLTTIEMLVARIIYQGIRTGDQQKLNFLLERIVGKVKDQIEHNIIRPTVIERLDGTQVQLGVIDEGNE